MALLVILVRQLAAPYRFPRWTRAWSALLLAALLMVSRRLYDFWLDVTLWSVLLPIGVSLSMGIGLYTLSIILTREVRLSHPTDAAWIEIDSFSTIVAWDAQAVRLFGWTTAEALQQTLMNTIIPSRDWEAHRDGMARLLATGHEGRVISRTFAVNAMRKTGDEIPVTIRITSRMQDDGTLHFVGQIRELGVL